MPRLPGGLPLGNLLAAVALTAAAAIPLVTSRPGTALRRIALGSVLASLLWLPAGVWLSGNAALNFSSGAEFSAMFWRFTGGLAVLIVALLVWTSVAALARCWKTRSA